MKMVDAMNRDSHRYKVVVNNLRLFRDKSDGIIEFVRRKNRSILPGISIFGEKQVLEYCKIKFIKARSLLEVNKIFIEIAGYFIAGVSLIFAYIGLSNQIDASNQVDTLELQKEMVDLNDRTKYFIHHYKCTDNESKEDRSDFEICYSPGFLTYPSKERDDEALKILSRYETISLYIILEKAEKSFEYLWGNNIYKNFCMLKPYYDRFVYKHKERLSNKSIFLSEADIGDVDYCGGAGLYSCLRTYVKKISNKHIPNEGLCPER